MHNTILPLLLLLLMPLSTSAQFYTITKESELMPDFEGKTTQIATKEKDTISNDAQCVRIGTLHIKAPIEKKKKWKVQKGDKRTSQNSVLPELTIPNLYAEIIRNGIRKSYWHRPSLKPGGSPLRHAGTSTTCSD